MSGYWRQTYTLWFSFLLAVLTIPSSASGDTLYRAPENLFTLGLPDSVKQIPSLKPKKGELFHQGFVLNKGKNHLTIHITASTTNLSSDAVAEDHKRTTNSLPGFSRISQGTEKCQEITFNTLFYSFSFTDNADVPVYRYDGIGVFGTTRILIYIEGSKNGVFFNIATFKNILHSIMIPQAPANTHSLAYRMKQLSESKKPVSPSVSDSTLPEAAADTVPPAVASGAEQNTSSQTVIGPAPATKMSEGALSVQTFLAWKSLLEWTARTRLTLKQEASLESALIEHIKAGRKSAQQVTSFTKTFSPYALYSLSPPESDSVRKRLQERFKELAGQKNQTKGGWDLFERVFTNQKAVVAKGTPPLSIQIRDGAMELMVFLYELLSADSPSLESVISPRQANAKAMIKLSANLRTNWNDFAKVEREAMCDILFQWSEIRLKWRAATPQARKQIVSLIKNDTQKVCILTGLTKEVEEEHSLAEIYLNTAISSPTILAILAAKLSDYSIIN